MSLLGGGRVLGDGLCAFRDGVLGKFTGQDQSYRCLDFPGGDCGLFVVCGELGCLSGYALKDIIDKGVQDGHGAIGDTSVWVDLLEDFVDVRGVGLLPCLCALLLVTRWGCGLLASLLLLSWGLSGRGLATGGWGLGCWLGRHFL